MKVLLDVNIENELEDDILIFDEETNTWINQRKDIFNKELIKEIKTLKDQLKLVYEDFDKFKSSVNEKLKTYHDALSIIVKGEE